MSYFHLCAELCSPKFFYWSPNSQHLRMCLYLEIRSLQRCLRVSEVTRVALIPQDWCRYKEMRTQTRTEGQPHEDTGKTCLPASREALGEASLPTGTSDLPLPGLGGDKFLLFKPPGLWCLLCSLSSLTHFL